MNIGKANNHYKKALNIDLRNLISSDCWNNLLDIVEIKNTIVHNNGMIDKRFRNTPTYTKIASMIEGNLIFLTPQIIQSYFNDVLELITSVTKYYNSLYENTLHSLIANFYFNSHPLNSDNCTCGWRGTGAGGCGEVFSGCGGDDGGDLEAVRESGLRVSGWED